MSRYPKRTTVLALVLTLCSLAFCGHALAADTSRLIVKFRDAGAKSAMPPGARIERLAAEAGISLAHVREMAIGAHVVGLGRRMTELEADAIAARLAADADVDYAVPDRRVKLHVVPNDAKQSFQEPYLGNTAAAISAYAAWDTTTGSASTVVAVIDSGIRPHEDLIGRVLPGYDFVSDVARANDGDGRDADPSDPGDWIDAADLASDAFKGDDNCKLSPSVWHGTSVASVIAANTNNRLYGSGIDWAAKILPVRVIGKCDGYDSDIIDGMAWAGGLHVPGVPDNAHPAQLINMSLGGAGACDAAYDDAIAAVYAHGITRAIIASAGNDGDSGPNTPSGCAGVISVAATGVTGKRASYSNFGARIDISAPGGETTRPGGAIWVDSNEGSTVPTLDYFVPIQGTSFAAPMVTGVASLMLGLAPNLTQAQLLAMLQATAKPFPDGSDCDPSICGAGIVDAGAAVKAAKAAGGPAPTVTVVEFYNMGLDHYFITWVPQEISDLDTGVHKGWVRTGYSFKAYMTAQAGTSPVCRFYIPPALGDSHFFGRGTAECDATGQKNPSFVNEDPAFMQMFLPVAGVCPGSTTEVYRVFSNRADANHRYMTDPAVRDQMAAKGWTIEGDGPNFVVMCAPM